MLEVIMTVGGARKIAYQKRKGWNFLISEHQRKPPEPKALVEAAQQFL